MLKFPTIASDGSQRPDEPRRLSQVTFSNTARSNSIVARRLSYMNAMDNSATLKALIESEEKNRKLLSNYQAIEIEHATLLNKYCNLNEEYCKFREIAVQNVWMFVPENCPGFKYIPKFNKNIRESKIQVGKYLISHEIGKGQFSVVKECINESEISLSDLKESNCNKYAVKVINKYDVITVQAILRIEQEIRALSILNSHENIVKLYDCVHATNNIYIVTELLSCDLHQNRINQNVVGVILRSIINGMVHMKEHKLVHRDLKPENIFLTVNRNTIHIKIGDFGLSQIVENDEEIGDFCGSPGFFAPECLLRSKYCPYKADVFSLSCIGAELLLPQSYFHNKWMSSYLLLQGNNAQDFSRCIQKSCAEITEDINRKFVSSISDFICNGLSFDPSLRPMIHELRFNEWIQNANQATAADVINGLKPRRVLSVTVPKCKKIENAILKSKSVPNTPASSQPCTDDEDNLSDSDDELQFQLDGGKKDHKNAILTKNKIPSAINHQRTVIV